MSAAVGSGHLLQPLGYVDGGMGGGGGGGADGPQGDERGGDGDGEHEAAHEHLYQVYVLAAPGVVSGEMDKFYENQVYTSYWQVYIWQADSEN